MLHQESLVVDTHNDVVQRILKGADISVRTAEGHSDLPRFREGGMDVQMFSIWVPPERKKRSYFEQANEQIDSIESFVRHAGSAAAMAHDADDVIRLVTDGKFVAMLGLEGGHHIGNDLEKIDHFYRRGVRYLTLTWNNSTPWATSAKDETDSAKKSLKRGLTSYGRKIVRRMNDIGMMVDVSHVGEETFKDVIEATSKPVIASHSSVWSLCNHRRNLKDYQLRAIAKNGGVVFINFNPGFIDSTYEKKKKLVEARYESQLDSLKAFYTPDTWDYEVQKVQLMYRDLEKIRPTMELIVDHIDYVVKLIGVDHVGLGSDFDGITLTPRGMDDVTFLPSITKELLKRGYTTAEIKKILGENFIRVLRANSPS